MCHHSPYGNHFGFVVDLCDQTEIIPADVENHARSVKIGGAKNLFHVAKVLPILLLA